MENNLEAITTEAPRSQTRFIVSYTSFSGDEKDLNSFWYKSRVLFQGKFNILFVNNSAS